MFETATPFHMFATDVAKHKFDKPRLWYIYLFYKDFTLVLSWFITKLWIMGQKKSHDTFWCTNAIVLRSIVPWDLGCRPENCCKGESLMIIWTVKDWNTKLVDTTKLTVQMKLKHIMEITKITLLWAPESKSKDKYCTAICCCLFVIIQGKFKFAIGI